MKLKFPALRKAQFMVTISLSAPDRMREFSASRRRSGTKTCFLKRTCNSRHAPKAHTIIALPTIWSGAEDPAIRRRNADTILGAPVRGVCEYKGRDRFRGQPAVDTGISSVFLGPRVVASHGRLSAEVAAELPVFIHNTALQAVPDYRLHGAISFQF